MIGYVTLGANDLERAERFYAPLMAELGVPLTRRSEKSLSWGKFGSGRGLSVTRPFDQQPAHFGNGVMIGLEAGSREKVHALHAVAMANGGTNEGAPGPRGSTYYGAYFRDPEGNKLCVYVLDAPAAAG